MLIFIHQGPQWTKEICKLAPIFPLFGAIPSRFTRSSISIQKKKKNDTPVRIGKKCKTQ